MSAWIVETMAASTALMIVVLMLRGPVARLAGARAAYLLWAAPALRMVMPPLPASWFGTDAATTIPAATMVVRDAAPTLIAASDGVQAMAHVPATWFVPALVAVWLGGAAVFLGYHIIAYRRFARALAESATPLSAQGRIRVASSAAIVSPLALGIISRSIIVPADFLHRYDPTERQLALAHEEAHHQRGDLIVNLAALVMFALHWFNPVAYFAHRAFRLDQEAACDAVVLATANDAERHAYATALVKSAARTVPLGVCAMATRSTLSARLRGIVAERHGALLLRSGAVFAALVVIGGSALTASALPQPLSDDSVSRATDDAERAIEGAVERAQARAADAQAQAELAAKSADALADQAMADAQGASDDARSAARDAAAASEDAERAADTARAEIEATVAEVEKSVAALSARDGKQRTVRVIRIDRKGRGAAVAPTIIELTPPAPPAPPSAPAAPGEPAAPAVPAAPAPPEDVAAIECPKGTVRESISTSQVVRDGKARVTTVIVCSRGRELGSLSNRVGSAIADHLTMALASSHAAYAEIERRYVHSGFVRQRLE